jgi:hypothetical protein
MDYQIFTDIIDWIKKEGYSCTIETTDDEIYYTKNIDANDLDHEIKQKSNSIKFPKIFADLYSTDFLIITTQIYKEGEYLNICVDIEDCQFTDSVEYVNMLIANSRCSTNIKKYFSRTFIDYELGESNLDSMIENIGTKTDFTFGKTFQTPNEDNIVFVQFNLVMNTRLSKYIKKDRCDFFILSDNFLSRKKGDRIKKYFDLSLISKKQQLEIIYIINSYYDNLTIIKKPSSSEIYFGIRGQEFIKKIKSKTDNKFSILVNEQIILPTLS